MKEGEEKKEELYLLMVGRLDALRNPIQNVVVGVWALLLDLTPAQLAARVQLIIINHY